MSEQDKKYCAGCQKWRLPTDGQTVLRNKKNRWICTTCLARANESPYASKKRSAKTN